MTSEQTIKLEDILKDLDQVRTGSTARERSKEDLRTKVRESSTKELRKLVGEYKDYFDEFPYESVNDIPNDKLVEYAQAIENGRGIRAADRLYENPSVLNEIKAENLDKLLGSEEIVKSAPEEDLEKIGAYATIMAIKNGQYKNDEEKVKVIRTQAAKAAVKRVRSRYEDKHDQDLAEQLTARAVIGGAYKDDKIREYVEAELAEELGYKKPEDIETEGREAIRRTLAKMTQDKDTKKFGYALGATQDLAKAA